MGGLRKLTNETVHEIRTSGKTDRFWSDRLDVDVNTVWKARKGFTFKRHATEPERKRRHG